MSRLQLLQAQLHQEVPLTRHMGLRIDAYDGEVVELTADFAANVNIHGTAFAGSLFSVCAVAGWALLHLRFEAAGIDALSVLGDADIRYSRPVRRQIRVSCGIAEATQFDAFMERVGRGERAAVELLAVIDSDGREAARFKGRYSAFFD
ncbi:MAG: YiiD C-terminal domain-containing protein [Gammaproteobacteria bacterium]|nr:YiiD C-terminal domain-containing protein [Gammaproteobacteria bacterium]